MLPTFLVRGGSGTISTIAKYDITQMVQCTLDVRLFNEKIGLFKDSSNQTILQTTYSSADNQFAIDSLSINRQELLVYLPPSQILSIGKFNTLYADWILFCNNYFAFPNGFTSLFDASSTRDLSGGLLSVTHFYELMLTNLIDMSSNRIFSLQGSFQLTNINQLLQTAVTLDSFGNRPNGNLAQGFLEGDHIVVTEGFKITLFTRLLPSDVSSNIVWPVPDDISVIAKDYQVNHYSQTTLLQDNYMIRTVQVPLYINLRNLSTQSYQISNDTITASIELSFKTLTGVHLDASGSPTLTSEDTSFLLFLVASIWPNIQPSDFALDSYLFSASTSSRATKAISRYRAVQRNAAPYDLSCNIVMTCDFTQYSDIYSSSPVLLQDLADTMFYTTIDLSFLTQLLPFFYNALNGNEENGAYWSTASAIQCAILQSNVQHLY